MKIIPTLDLARKLIAEQFHEYASLPITDVKKQGHDNRTYSFGRHMLIRMPTAADLRFELSFFGLPLSFSYFFISFLYFFMSFPRRRESSNILKRL